MISKDIIPNAQWRNYWWGKDLHSITLRVLRTWRYDAIPMGSNELNNATSALRAEFFAEFIVTCASMKRTWSWDNIEQKSSINALDMKKGEVLVVKGEKIISFCWYLPQPATRELSVQDAGETPLIQPRCPTVRNYPKLMWWAGREKSSAADFLMHQSYDKLSGTGNMCHIFARTRVSQALRVIES